MPLTRIFRSSSRTSAARDSSLPPGKTVNLLEAAGRTLPLEENARPEDKQPVKRLVHEPSKVALVHCQQDVRPSQCAEQHRAVLGYRENGGAINCQDVVHDQQSRSQCRPVRASGRRQVWQVPKHLLQPIGCGNQNPAVGRSPVKDFARGACPSNRWRRAERWCPEIAPLALTEPLHIRLIPRNPTGDLFPGKLAWLRQLGALRAQTGRQEQKKFLLLLRRQGIGCSFDFGERAPRETIRQRPLNDKRRSGPTTPLECGGKRSATPLYSGRGWRSRTSQAGRNPASAGRFALPAHSRTLAAGNRFSDSHPRRPRFRR